MINYTVDPNSPYLLGEETLNKFTIYEKEEIINTHYREIKNECNIIN